ncbi:MAG: NAD-dependent epimerase/dehydratase family protein [Solirubrobacteraceae bacterium]
MIQGDGARATAGTERRTPGSRRVLVLGVSTPWGGRLAQLLEQDANVEAIVGVDPGDPRHELQRTEFVRVGADEGLLRRVIRAASIDTVVDCRLVCDPVLSPLSRVHEINVDGTRSVLAACGGPGTSVRKLVFKSAAHWYGSSAEAPAFLGEDMGQIRAPATAIERDLSGAEEAVGQFAAAHPETTVTVLRFASTVGGEVRGGQLMLLGLPVVPAILGFDPRWQLLHEDDGLQALRFAVHHELSGPYNVAADGVLVLSEIVSLLGKPLLPVLPPWGTVFAAVQLRRLGLRVPVELLRELRYGRGLDNRRLKAEGFHYRYTTREAVLKLRAQQRLKPLLGRGDGSYRYEREVEEFLRRSPSVRLAARDGRRRDDEFGEMFAEDELIELIASLEPEALMQLRDHEAAGRARQRVLDVLDRRLTGRANDPPR